MFLLSLLVLCCFIISTLNGQLQSFHYECKNDVSINASLQQSSFIASFKTIDRLLCLGECNRNPSCLSCSYNNDVTRVGVDCYLYNRVFTSNHYFNAINVDWYSKTSAPTIANTATTNTSISTSLTSTTTTTATTRTTTQSNSIPSDCNCSLVFYFTNTTLNSSITTYNGITFNALMSTEMAILNNTPVYFLAEYNNNTLIKMSGSWQYLTNSTTITQPRVIKWANDHLYVSSTHGFHKIDYNLNIIKSIDDTGAAYHGIYHNSSHSTFTVAVWSRNRVDWTDADLTVLANMSLGTYNPMGVSGYGDSLYVSAYSGTSSTVIYVIRNRVINNTLLISNTTAMSIYSIVIDDYGYMALTLKTQKTVQLYHINGTSTGLNLTLTQNVYHINIDFNRRMMISTQNALNFFN